MQLFTTSKLFVLSMGLMLGAAAASAQSDASAAGSDSAQKPKTEIPAATPAESAKAKAAADYLMALTDSNIKTGVIDPEKKFSKSKARRLFTKQSPCIACHTAKFRKRTRGGISGPDLTQAGSRLNPDWVYARIENPQYWDPKTWMPKFELSHKKRELLAQFISSMK